MSCRPSELAITLACLPGSYSGPSSHAGWMCADEVRGRLTLFGFDCSTQQVAAWLGRMARTDAPWVERDERDWGSVAYYRVTAYGKTDITNRLPLLKPYTPWLPTYRYVERAA